MSSSVCFSLGRIEHRDPKFFAAMSNAMIEKIDQASSQSIANVLLAYEAVNIIPPRILLDSWTNEKLGIMGRHSYISKIVGDAIA